MSCYSCGSNFSAFRREHGCKNCGYAFCMNCLPNKLPIVKLNNEKHRVCVKCYNILTGKVKPKEDNPARYSPPENYKKRMAALEEREAKGDGSGHSSGHTGSKGSGGGHHKAVYKGMSKADIEIQQRLEKLREKTPQEIAASKVSSEEIDNRLAALKGMDPSRYNKSSKPVYHPPDRRTQQEQMNDLLEEISNEVELDSLRPDPAQEISARLERLKAQDKPADQEDENNLNKPSLRDSQSFTHNITSSTDSSRSGNAKKSTTGQSGKLAESKDSVESKVSVESKDSVESKVSVESKDLTQKGNDPTQKDKDSPQQGKNSEIEQEISTEEVSRILKDAADELEQDAQKALRELQQDKDIMKKLQEIKQRRKESSSDVNKNVEMQSDSENEDDDDDEKTAQSIIRQAVEESKLDEAVARDGHDTSSVSSKSRKAAKKIINTDDEWYDPDELPYCIICTEDATVRCLGCDRDLYCDACFKEGHKELGLDDHVTLKFTPPEPEKT